MTVKLLLALIRDLYPLLMELTAGWFNHPWFKDKVASRNWRSVLLTVLFILVLLLSGQIAMRWYDDEILKEQTKEATARPPFETIKQSKEDDDRLTKLIVRNFTLAADNEMLLRKVEYLETRLELCTADTPSTSTPSNPNPVIPSTNRIRDELKKLQEKRDGGRR